MDWDHAIARNLAALLRIADALCAMAGLSEDAAPGANRTSWPVTLPRHLHTAVLSVLRPAEAALRRLIVIAARDIVAVLPPAERARIAKVLPTAQPSRTGIFLHDRPAGAGDLAYLSRDPHMARDMIHDTASKAAPDIAPGISPVDDSARRPPAFALFDPLKRFASVRQGPSRSVPRILFNLDTDTPAAQPPRPTATPEDPVGAARLCQRLAALRHALDDLPAQARRLARWRARRRLRGRGRLSPLRPGSPPGHRRNGLHPVDEALQRCHGLAIDIVTRRDTS